MRPGRNGCLVKGCSCAVRRNLPMCGLHWDLVPEVLRIKYLDAKFEFVVAGQTMRAFNPTAKRVEDYERASRMLARAKAHVRRAVREAEKARV